MRVVDVKEARRAAKLLQIGLPERLLQNDVDQVLSDIIVLVLEFFRQVHLSLRILVDRDLGSLSAEDRREN